jgi:hypothetical protein
MPQGACFLIPASGNRNTSGTLNNLGTNGYYWGASPSSTSGRNLNFNGTTVNPANTNNRQNAYPVRCVKNLTLLSCGSRRPAGFRRAFGTE